MKSKKDLKDFMKENEVTFTQLVKSFSFWSGLTNEEKDSFIMGWANEEYE